MGWTRRWGRRLLAVVHRDAVDREMNAEIAFHLEMETKKNLQRGMSPDLARRQAAVAFGGVEKFKEEVRESRRLAWIEPLFLDVKLGFRMLLKYPGLAVVGGAGLAVAIAIAAVSFAVINAFVAPSLPLDEGDRIVSIQNWNSRLNEPNRRSLYDFAVWRNRATTIREIGAARLIVQNLSDGEQVEAVRVAEMTASGFRLARTQPLLGRYVLAADEAPGSRPVAVIGFDLWKRRFNSDSTVIGRSCRLGGDVYTIVGVMPQGFGFPVNQSLWTPLRVDPSHVGRGDGPEIQVFGRLAPGASFAQAQAELTALGAGWPPPVDSGADLRPQVLPYTYPFFDLNSPEAAGGLRLLQAFVVLVLVYVSVNIAILMYARTAARTDEFAVRTALGGTRRRVVLQLLFEALVLSLLAAVAGTAIAAAVLQRANTFELSTGGLPFWMDFRLSLGTVVYATLLAILAGTIVGVLPALKVTSRNIESSLRAIGSRGVGMHLGRWWTALIVGQVAMAVTILPLAAYTVRQTSRHALAEPGFATNEYLIASLFLDDVERSDTAFGPDQSPRYEHVQAEVLQRLAGEPWVTEAVMTGTVPGQARREVVSLDRSADNAESRGELVGVNRVGHGFFDLFRIQVLTGRDFEAADLSPSARVAIVNRSFVSEVANGESVLGRRLRLRGSDAEATTLPHEDWYEIVGVVDDVPYPDSDVPPAGVYFPIVAAAEYPVTVVVHTNGGVPAAAASRLRAIAGSIDSTLRFGDIATLDETREQEQFVWRIGALGITFLTASVLLLSAAGIYALMSFTVTKRRREIGLRAALGAQADRLLWSIFSRSARQITTGVAIGLVAASIIEWGLAGGALLGGQGIVLVPAAGLLMAVVGLIAAAGPARRALRIDPSEALRGL